MHGTNLPPFMAPVKRVPKRSPGPSEDQIHRALVKHIRSRAVPGVIWFHPANGGKRNAREAKKFKDMGVQPGVADLILIHRGHVYALELKSLAGRPTVAQMEWMSAFNAAGGNGCICHGLDRAIATLERWGLLR